MGFRGIQLKSRVISIALGLVGLTMSASSFAFSNIHYTFDCDNLSWAYRTTGTGGPITNCTCSDSSTTTYTEQGPGGVCTISVSNPGSNGTGTDPNTGLTVTCDCAQISGVNATGTNVTGSAPFTCDPGELQHSTFGCWPAPACNSGAPASTFTLLSSTTSGQMQTQVYRIDSVSYGDVFHVGIASRAQGHNVGLTDTPTTMASKIAAYWNGMSTYACWSESANLTVTASGDQITFYHSACHGPGGLSSAQRYSPTCTSPTPTPTATPGIYFTPNTHNFGNVNVGTASGWQSVTITNSTSTSYMNCSVMVDNNPGGVFNLADLSNCTALPASSSCTFRIQAAPSSATTFSSVLTLSCGPVVCSNDPNDKKQKLEFFADLGKDLGKKIVKASAKSLVALEELLVGPVGACTVPTCPPTTYCDCFGGGYLSCTPTFASQNECYCAVGYNTAVTCAGPPPPPTDPSACRSSGMFSVTGVPTTSPTPSCNPSEDCTAFNYDPAGPMRCFVATAPATVVNPSISCACNSTDGALYDYCGGTPVGAGTEISGCYNLCPIGSPSPSPSPSPSASPPGCYDTGGAGRACTSDATCCPGYTCEIAGAQPLRLHPDPSSCPNGAASCTVSSHFKQNFSYTPDPILAGQAPTATLPDLFTATGPSKICVDSSRKMAAGVNTSENFYPLPASLPAIKVDPTALRWDGNGFRCELRDTGTFKDNHRLRTGSSAPDGCACVSGYEPVVLPDTMTVAMGRTKLDWLWAQILDALQNQKAAVKTVAKAYSKVVPDAKAILMSCTSTSVGQTCNDYGGRYVPGVIGTCSGTMNTNGVLNCRANQTDCQGNCLSEFDYYGVGMANPPCAGGTCVCSANFDFAGSTCNPTPPSSPSPSPSVSPSPSSSPPSSPPPSSPGPSASPGAINPILYDNGTMSGGGVSWNPWLSASQNYGIRIYTPPSGPPVPIAIANDADVIAANGGNSGARVACTRACSDNASGATRACWSYKQCADPRISCVCPSGQLFDHVSWKCIVCKEGEMIDPVSGTCQCPVDYALYPNATDPNGKCRPIVKGIEQFKWTTAGVSEGYPVCGPNRLPVKDDRTIFNVASSFVPKTDMKAFVPTYPTPYPYATPVGSPDPTPSPYYLNWDYQRCVCATTVSESPPYVWSPATPIAELSSTSGSNPRFVDDTYFGISKRGSDGKPSVPYGPVAIARDDVPATSPNNPRRGDVFGVGQSQCNCPNVNETPAPLNASDPLGLAGVSCQPALSATPADIRLIKFNRAIHDTASKSIVMNRGNEPKTAGGDVVTNILLPNKTTDYDNFTKYERGIWTCALGLTFNPSNGTCTFVATDNACDATSEVSPKVTGSDYATRFSNTINKKLGCCGFQFGSTGNLGASPVKFDCIANENHKYPDFNTLWASRDDDADGGRINAITLYNKAGREITGWYTTDGVRCNNIPSLSNTPIVPGRVNTNLVQDQQAKAAGQFEATSVKYHTWGGSSWVAATGSALPMPSGAEWTDLTGRLAGATANATTPPNPVSGSLAEVRKARECPIYIRAAAVYGCDDNAVGTTQKRTFKQTDALGRTKYRCAAAAQTTIHVEVRQVFEIMGTKPMPTLDTILDSTQTRSITLQEIWQVNGFGVCPQGGTRVGDACTW